MNASGRARVLVVDDSEVVRHLIRINLELEGFDVAEAGDGRECLALLDRGPAPDVVTLDLRLPDGEQGGFAVLRRIKTAPALAATRVVVVTAAAQSEDVRRGTTAGADAYITKPFDPEHLVETVRRLAAGGPAADPVSAPRQVTLPAPPAMSAHLAGHVPPLRRSRRLNPVAGTTHPGRPTRNDPPETTGPESAPGIPPPEPPTRRNPMIRHPRVPYP